MAINFKKIFGGGRRKSVDQTIMGLEDLASLFSGQDTVWQHRHQLEQYSKSLYVFAAVNKIATKVSSIDLDFYQITNAKGDTKDIFDHPAVDLIAKPNPFQTRGEFLKTTWINKKLTGEAYWMKVRNAGGEVVELWNLRPDMMVIVSDPEKYIKSYEFHKTDGEKVTFDPTDIIYFKDPNPLNQFRGQSPIAAAKHRIETEQEASRYQKNFFKNNARPDALLITTESLDGDQKMQMTTAWEEKHSDKHNSSRIGILEGGMQYQQVSISQREMDYIESIKFTRQDILVALGVPESVIFSGASNYATSQTDFAMFLSETITPEMQQLVDVINEMLVSVDFGEQFYFDYDDPTPDDAASERADYLAGYGRWLTTNEIRAAYSLPPLPGADVIATTPVADTGAAGTAIPKGITKSLGAATKATTYSKRVAKSLRIMQGRPLLKMAFKLGTHFKKEWMQTLRSQLQNKKRKTKSTKNSTIGIRARNRKK